MRPLCVRGSLRGHCWPGEPTVAIESPPIQASFSPYRVKCRKSRSLVTRESWWSMQIWAISTSASFGLRPAECRDIRVGAFGRSTNGRRDAQFAVSELLAEDDC